MSIHPTAVVHPKAELDADVTVGPFCVIGEHVTIGKGTVLRSHVCVEGITEIGQRCSIFPYTAIGTPPQHLRYHDEPTRVRIGDDNILRECVTIHRGTAFGGGVTTIGRQNFLMAYVHVAHDCHIGDHVVMANATSLGGHIVIGNHAVIGGLVGVHQHVRIGAYAMIGGCSSVVQDVPPFMCAVGNRASLYGVNVVGLRRGGMSAQHIRTLKRVYHVLFRGSLRMADAVKQAREQCHDNPDVMALLEFMETSTRGTCHATHKNTAGHGHATGHGH